MNEEPRIEILVHDAAEPDCDWEDIQPVSAVLEKLPWATGIVDHSEFIRLEYVIDTTKVTFKRIW